MSNLNLFDLPETPKPLFAYAGSKTRLLSVLAPYIPVARGAWHEPFFGSGSVFFSIGRKFDRAFLSDGEPGLAHMWRMIRDRPRDVHSALMRKIASHSRKTFNESKNFVGDPVEKAAAFLYVSIFAFHGVPVYRLSGADGRVFFDDGKKTGVDWWSKISAVSAALARATFSCQDFSACTPERGDVVYMDPPYDRADVKYTKDRFTPTDQIRVREHAEKCREVGARVLVSNAGTSLIREIFAGWRMHEIRVPRTIGPGKDGVKFTASELLIVSPD